MNGKKYTDLYVARCSKRNAWLVQIPTVWSDKPFHKKNFADSHYRYPKLKAEQYCNTFLEWYYGKERAPYLRSIPRYSQRFGFGCCVSVYEGSSVIRGVTRKRITLAWSELDLDPESPHWYKRKQTSFIYHDHNRIEVWHKASLEAAKRRSEVTLSELDPRVFEFEYDLDFIC